MTDPAGGDATDQEPTASADDGYSTEGGADDTEVTLTTDEDAQKDDSVLRPGNAAG